MDRFVREDREDDEDVSTVESGRNDLIPEEFPEGSYGTKLTSESLGKSSPWRIGQRTNGAFAHENRTLHAGEERDYPGEDDYGMAVPEVQDEP